MNNDNDVVKILNNLIKTSRDGEEGFRSAAEHATDQELKNILLERAKGCNHAVIELQKHVLNYDNNAENIEQDGTVLGAMHRGWLNFKSMIAGNSDQAILTECMRGETVAKEEYELALKQELPEGIHTLLQHQYDGLMENYNLIDSLLAKFSN
ncbi:MAG: PA2169 family four-helix-bundle protein [Rickettsiaceae bacterium]|nr:MAG: PA2169 family four-helix-bundle protein [Rickettsiaceae bacterium]